MKKLFCLFWILSFSRAGLSQNCPTSDWYPNGADDLFSYPQTYCTVVAKSDSLAVVNATFKFGSQGGRPMNSNFKFGIVYSSNWSDINTAYWNYIPLASANSYPPAGLKHFDTLFTNIIVEPYNIYPGIPKDGGYYYYLRDVLPDKTYYVMPYIVWYNNNGKTPVYYLYFYTPVCFKTTNTAMNKIFVPPTATVVSQDTVGVTVSCNYKMNKVLASPTSVVYSGLCWNTDSTKLDTLTPGSNKNFVYFTKTNGEQIISGTYSSTITGLKSKTTYYCKPVFSIVTPTSSGPPHVNNVFGQTQSFTTPLLYPQTWFNQITSNKNAVTVDGNPAISSDSLSARISVGWNINAGNVNLDSAQFLPGVCWSTDSTELLTVNPLSFKNFIACDTLKNCQGLSKIYAFNIKGLRPGTKYYYRGVFSWINSKKAYGLPLMNKFSKFNKVYTRSGIPPLAHNKIKGSKVICFSSRNAKPPRVVLSGEMPYGGYGTTNFKFQWIQSSDTGKTWVKCSYGNAKDYLFTYAGNPSPPALQQIMFKRIAIQMYGTNPKPVLYDTSAAASVYIAQPNYNFNVQPVLSMAEAPGTPSSVLMLKAELPGALGEYTANWFFSPAGLDSLGYYPDQSINGLLYVLKFPDQAVKATLSYGNGCPNFDTQPIGSSNYDGDGNVYPVIQIGTQFWMASNIRSTHFQDGTPLTYIPETQNFIQTAGPAFWWINNDSLNFIRANGALYNYNVITTDKICPVGWHVANRTDWATLFTYVGNQDGTFAARYLKTSNWKKGAFATNHYNFNALPSGQISDSGIYRDKGVLGGWWSGGLHVPGVYYMTSTNDRSFFIPESEEGKIIPQGHSIRCVQNYIKVK